MSEKTEGTWNLGGYNLPDYGWTEGIRELFGKNPSAQVTTFLNNPLQIQARQAEATRQAVSSGSNTGNYSGILNIDTSSGNTNPAPAPSGGSSGGGGGGSTTQAPSQMGVTERNSWAIANGYTGWDDYINNARSQQNGTAALDAEANALYDQGMNEFARQEAQMNENKTADFTNLNSNVANQESKLKAEGEGLITDQNTEEQTVMSKLQSAYEDAVRAYNALSQKGGAKYGLGSSMGKYLGEIATQQFYKNQGDLSVKKAESTQAFVQNRAKIKQYVTGKIDDLNQYRTEAMESLKRVYQQSLDSINAGRGQLAANKSAAKMALMQDAINQARQIAAQNDQLKQNIFATAINGMQTTMGRALSPQELIAVSTDFGIDLGTTLTGYNPNAATGSTGYLYQGKVQDPFAQTNPFSG